MSVKYLILLLFLFFFLSSCIVEKKESLPPLQVFPYVDLKRYVGTWYEIARFPNSFQEGCVGTKAIYSLLEDGKIGVVNECRRDSFEGRVSSAKGKAWVVDKKTNAKLKVSFFWPFSGHYWIIDLGKDYEYAVVGHPKRKYLWILSRSPQMDEKLYNSILEKLTMQSYDIKKLIKTPQKEQQSAIN
jgi:apolipoprotein D and lipocalin family protein